MTTPAEKTLRVDIVSDVVCPWCIIGYKQLEWALRLTGVAAQIRWHPFELNPQMDDKGEHLGEHIVAKYGISPEEGVATRERLTTIGKELGFRFAYSDDMRIYNTFRAHQLLTWANTKSLQHELEMELFSSYFTHLRNVSDVDVLVNSARAVGLDADEARDVLEQGRFVGAVREDEQVWIAGGIEGVPAVVFEQRHLVSGAQGVESYVRLIRQIVTERTP